MKKRIVASLFTIVVFCLSTIALLAEIPSASTAAANSRRLGTLRLQNKKKVDEITEEILKQAKRLRLAWEYEHFQYVFNYDSARKSYSISSVTLKPEFMPDSAPDPSNMSGGYSPQGNSQGVNRADCIGNKDYALDYKVSPELISKALEEKYGRGKSFMERLAESAGPFPKVDIRGKIDLQEAALKYVSTQFTRTPEELYEEEERFIAEEYPLYKEGDIIEISFSPREGVARRTYKGVFKRLGRFKIRIGKDILSMDELPEKLRVRFNETMNREARENMRQRHPIFSRYNVEQEEAAAAKVNEMLLNQFERNLPLGWIYIDGTWKLPEDLVTDVLQYRAESRWFYALPPSVIPPPAKDMIDYMKEIGVAPEIQQQQGRF